MGNWMTYQRARARSNFRRKPLNDSDPYFRDGEEHHNCSHWITEGDFNRMERDYLDPVYPEPPWATREPGSDPSTQVAAATSVDVETVRKVLRYVFLEQS